MIRSVSLRGLTRLLADKKEFGSLHSHVARGAVGTFALKLAATSLTFIISMLLARLLGATGYGAYAYAIAWINLLSVPAVLGLDKLLIREIAAYQIQSACGLMSGLLRRADQVVLFLSVSLALLAAVTAWTLASRFDARMLSAFWVALIMLPFVALTRLRQAALQGLNRVVVGQLPEMLIQPTLFIALVGGVYLLVSENLNATQAVGVNVMAGVVAFLIGTVLLNKNLPETVMAASPVYQTSVWVRSALPLLFIGGMQIINARIDTLMLGAIHGAKAVGIYAIANRGAWLILIVLASVNTVLAPTISRLYTAQDMVQLQRIVTKAARITLGVSLLIWLVLLLLGNWFLSLFGGEYVEGQLAMVVLSTGLVLCTTVASVGLLLMMTGYEKDAAWVSGIAALVNIILNALLIPTFAIEGAAMASTASTVLFNILLTFRVRKRIGIDPSIFGSTRKRKDHERIP